jgi:flagellar M-ring protein FliF
MIVQNLLQLWSQLSLTRRMVVIGATSAMFLAVFGLSRMASTPNLALLYAGLDSSAAGQIVEVLEQQGVEFQIQGDSILVPEGQRDSLRMTLASQGLPAAGAAGYELLDGMSGFSTTSQMFDAAYWRAKEGELARTILANPQIRAARVHIAQTPAQAFRRENQPTASVTLTTISGSLDDAQAQALRHLIAAAVSGMRPEDVSVIDSVGGLVPLRGQDGGIGADAEDRATLLRQNVERLLAARVGPGGAVVEVSVDLVTDSEQITERTFDPQGRVAISTDTEDKTNSATEPGGDVTVASNLPTGDAGAGGNGQSQGSETRERVNYEVSETQRELIKAPGSLRKISVAVLVDGLLVTAADGTVTQEARPDEELAVLRELVASAVGLDEARGDVLTLRSLAFEPTVQAGTLVEAGGLLSGLGLTDILSIVQFAVLALVALILGLFVVRPVLMRPPLALAPPNVPLALPRMTDGAAAAGQMVLTGVIDDGRDLSGLPVVSQTDADAIDADPVARLRRLIQERQSESVEILRGWMEAAEERG